MSNTTEDKMERKYYKVTEVAEIFGMSTKKVRAYCHGPHQTFAFQAVTNGNIMIDLKKFETFLSGGKPDHRRRIR